MENKITIKFSIVTFLIFNLSLHAQESKEWHTESKKEGANFYQIRENLEEKFSNKKNDSIYITAKTNNITQIEENDYVKYRRWEWYMSTHVKIDGSFPESRELFSEYEQFIQKRKTAKVSSAVSANWVNISRASNTGGYWGMGRTSSIAFHPTQPNTFWVAANIGGVWKTTNGGASYTAQGDNLPYLGVSDIIVDNSNPNILYACIGDNTRKVGLGIYKSTNGGNTWNATGFSENLSGTLAFYNLVQSPSNPSILLVATNRGLYRTLNAGNSWTLIQSGNCTDVEYKVNDGNTVYALFNNALYKSFNAASSFSAVTTAPFGLSNIAVSKANTGKILMWSRNSIWVSLNNAGSWSQKNLPLDINNGNNVINFLDTMIMSPNNANILYAGGIDIYRSNNNGSSWFKIGRWCCNGQGGIPEVHADHRNLLYHPIKGTIFSCNDGGVDEYNENIGNWSQRSNGLVIPQYYTSASAESNGAIIDVGSQDNGGSRRLSNFSWINKDGGDASTQAIDPTNSNIAYSHYNPAPSIIRTFNGWNSFTNVKPNEGGLVSWWVLPYTLNPSNPNSVVAAYHAIYKSNNQGSNWVKISPNFANKGDYFNAFRSIAIAPSNANYIYAGRPNTLYHTFNNGQNWGSSNFTETITSIAVKPDNSQVVYVTCGQFTSGKKVFKSTNGGITWKNISAGIPNIPVHSVVYQKNSNELLYIGTDFGVFYRDASMTSWQPYGNGLPKTQVNHLHINYDKDKLRAATYGRGIYEVDLLGLSAGNSCELTSVKASPTSNSATISWNDTGASNYLWYKPEGGTWKLAESNIVGTTYTLTGLAPNTSYIVDLYAQCPNGTIVQQLTFSTFVLPLENTNVKELSLTKIYPNPTDEFFILNYTHSSNNLKIIKIKMMNDMGVIVKESEAIILEGNNSIKVITKEINVGIYTLLVLDENNKKIHVQRILIRK